MIERWVWTPYPHWWLPSVHNFETGEIVERPDAMHLVLPPPAHEEGSTHG